MSALQVLIDGFLKAAEMLALLIVLPAAAALPVPIEAHGAHLPRVQSTLDVRLLGTLADVRTREHIRNDSATPIDLALHLPAIDAHTEALRIHRRGRMVDLLHIGDCGGDTGVSTDDVAGRVQLAVDETIADALQLAPGETALIETVATRPLVNAGAFFRLAVPPHAASESRAWLVDQADAPFLIVIVAGNASGVARVTLRPTSGAAETIELGELNAVPGAFVIPLANRAALAALAAGAIELEAQSKDYAMWSTIPAQLRSGASFAALRASELGNAR